MKFTLQITERDRWLLVVTGIFLAALLLFARVSYPLMTAIADRKARIEKNDIRIRELREMEIRLPELEKEHEEKHARLTSIQEKAYPALRGSDVDGILTDQAANFGLQVFQIQIRMPEEPKGAAAYGGGGGGIPDQQEGLYIVQAKLEAAGNKADVDAWLDNFSMGFSAGASAARITSIKWNTGNGDAGEEAAWGEGQARSAGGRETPGAETFSSVAVSVEFYMRGAADK